LRAAEVGKFTTAGRDAEEYATTALRHDVLLLKINLERGSAADRAEIDRLRAHGESIQAKYAAAAPAARAEYERRVKQLSATRVAPGVRAAVAEFFPSVAEVTTAYSDERQRAAALQILAGKLKERAGPPLVPEAAAKVALYETAWTSLNPKARSDYPTRLDAIDALRRSQTFNAEVLGKFMPIYAHDAVTAVRKADREGRLTLTRDAILRANWFVALVALAVPFLLLLKGRKDRQDESDPTGAFALPPALRRVHVIRRSYPVHLNCGQVLRADAVNYKVTRTYREETKDDPRSLLASPDKVTTSKSTHSYYSLTVETPEGGRFEPTHDYGIAKKGELLSLVRWRDTLLLAYNHSTGKFSSASTAELAGPHSFPGWAAWLLTMVVAVGGFYGVQRGLLTTELANEDVFAKQRIQMWMFSAAPLAAIYVLAIKREVQKRRERVFREKWEPKFREFLPTITDKLERHFRSPS